MVGLLDSADVGDWELAVAVGEADGMSVVMEGEPDGSADEPVVVGVAVGVADGTNICPVRIPIDPIPTLESLNWDASAPTWRICAKRKRTRKPAEVVVPSEHNRFITIVVIVIVVVLHLSTSNSQTKSESRRKERRANGVAPL